jgi:hypothetical protein
MAPDPRRTGEAVRQVRAVYPNATQFQLRDGTYVIHEAWAGPSSQRLGHGATAKEAWWNAVPKALAKALQS